jgi:hypothetical protein
MSWTITPQTKAPVDPYRSQVSLLLHGDGANGSTTITDSSPTPKMVTAVGNAQISTAQSKPGFGGSSIAFDGAGDYLTIPNNAAFDFGTGDFTIESWVYIAANSSPDDTGARYATITSTYPSATLNVPCYAFTIDGNSTTTGTGISFYNRDASSGYSVSASVSISQNAWHHVAVSRLSATTRLFLDGALQTSGTLGNQTVTSVNTLRVGSGNFTGYLQQLNGYIDDLRITKGVARYTSNFTPPTAPFPDI